MNYTRAGRRLRLSEEEFTVLLGIVLETAEKLRSSDLPGAVSDFLDADTELFISKSSYDTDKGQFVVDIPRARLLDVLSNFVFRLCRHGGSVYSPGPETREKVAMLRNKKIKRRFL